MVPTQFSEHEWLHALQKVQISLIYSQKWTTKPMGSHRHSPRLVSGTYIAWQPGSKKAKRLQCMINAWHCVVMLMKKYIVLRRVFGVMVALCVYLLPPCTDTRVYTQIHTGVCLVSLSEIRRTNLPTVTLIWFSYGFHTNIGWGGESIDITTQQRHSFRYWLDIGPHANVSNGWQIHVELRAFAFWVPGGRTSK